MSPVDKELGSPESVGRMTRRAFAWGGASAIAGVAGWKWVTSRSVEGLVPWPLRRVLELDEKVGRSIFRSGHLAPTFAASRSKMPRVNGKAGIDLELNVDAWRLQVQGPKGAQSFNLAEVKALPRFEMTTELKCIEGWSTIVQWAGARLSDLAALTGLAARDGKPGRIEPDSPDLLRFASLATPDGKYYVGLDMPSAMHPQSLLCYEMNGQPLNKYHGAPLRLAIPVKYGIKNLKQIGTLRFTDTQPADYWAERGYDWYSGH